MNSPVHPPFVTSAREFIESVLGFGAPIEGATLAAMFQTDASVLHYGRGPHAKASINAVDKNTWRGSHINWPGAVLYDLYSNPLDRARTFIEKELAKQGFAAAELVNPAYGNAFKELSASVLTFFGHYENANLGASVQSSLILQQQEGCLNWDMTIQVFIENADSSERIYLRYVFPGVVHNVMFLINNDQVKATVQQMREFFRSFGEHTRLFAGTAHIEFAPHIFHQIVHNREVTAEEVYTNYANTLRQNQHWLRGVPAAERSHWLEGYPWNKLSPVQRIILSAAADIARIQIGSYFNVNVEEAKA